MKMSLVVDGLRSDVVAVGELGDDDGGRGGRADRRRARPLGARARPRSPLRRRRRADRHAPGRARGHPGGRRRRRYDLRRGRTGSGCRRRRARATSSRLASALRLGEGLKSRLEEGAAARGGLGEHLHRAHARARHVEQPEPERPWWATACTATARPERSSGHGEDVRDPGRRAPLRGDPCGSGGGHRRRHGPHRRVGRSGRAGGGGAGPAGHRGVPAGRGPPRSWR